MHTTYAVSAPGFGKAVLCLLLWFGFVLYEGKNRTTDKTESTMLPQATGMRPASSLLSDILGCWCSRRWQLSDEAHPARPAAVSNRLAVLVADQHNSLILAM